MNTKSTSTHTFCAILRGVLTHQLNLARPELALAAVAMLLCGLLYSFRSSNSDIANAFLNSLEPEQREKARLEMDDSNRYDWHFLPASMYPRAGIALAELNGKQKQLLHHLLQAYLSKKGYAKIKGILELESILAELENNPAYRDPEKYYVAFYGQPAEDKAWGWNFQGHHIALHFTVVDDAISFSPRFLGANPAEVRQGPKKGLRVLEAEEDFALQLVNSLSEEQRRKAIFRLRAFTDIVTSNAAEVEPLEAVGIPAKDMTPEQRFLLETLIYEYASTVPIDIARERMEKIRRADLDNIRFGWAGATELGKPHYYRIQSGEFLIEFDNIQNNANHIHTVWRDFDGDFGRDLIREHYQHSGHH